MENSNEGKIIKPNKARNILEATMSSEELSEKYRGYNLQFIVEGLFFKNGINLIGAERGSGKTRFMIFLGLAIAYGQTEVLGYKIQSWGNVLFLNYEIPEDQFTKMIEPIENYFKIKLGARKIYRFDVLSLKSYPTFLIKEIEISIYEKKSDFIFVDGYKAFASRIAIERKVNEWNNHNMLDLFDSSFNIWKENYNVTIILSNHTNKGTKGSRSHSDLLYGPSALMDYVDQTALIRKGNEQDERLLIPDKSRFSAEGLAKTNLFVIDSDDPQNPKVLFFKLVEEDVNEADFMYREDRAKYDKATKEQAKTLAESGMKQELIAEKLLGNKNRKGTISKWLKKANS